MGRHPHLGGLLSLFSPLSVCVLEWDNLVSYLHPEGRGGEGSEVVAGGVGMSPVFIPRLPTRFPQLTEGVE